MPIYEYRCDKCGEEFELLIRGDSDRKSAECPKCGSKEFEKLFSVFAAQSATNTPSVCEPCGGGDGPPPSCNPQGCPRCPY